MLLNCGAGEDPESLLDCKETKPVNPKENQLWIFIGRTDAEAEAPILWPPYVKSRFVRKDPDAGKDWRWEEKGRPEDEMVRWHHWCNGPEFAQSPGDSEGREPGMCSPWDHRERDTWGTEQQQQQQIDVKDKFPAINSQVEENKGLNFCQFSPNSSLRKQSRFCSHQEYTGPFLECQFPHSGGGKWSGLPPSQRVCISFGQNRSPLGSWVTPLSRFHHSLVISRLIAQASLLHYPSGEVTFAGCLATIPAPSELLRQCLAPAGRLGLLCPWSHVNQLIGEARSAVERGRLRVSSGLGAEGQWVTCLNRTEASEDP